MTDVFQQQQRLGEKVSILVGATFGTMRILDFGDGWGVTCLLPCLSHTEEGTARSLHPKVKLIKNWPEGWPFVTGELFYLECFSTFLLTQWYYIAEKRTIILLMIPFPHDIPVDQGDPWLVEVGPHGECGPPVERWLVPGC